MAANRFLEKKNVLFLCEQRHLLCFFMEQEREAIVGFKKEEI